MPRLFAILLTLLPPGLHVMGGELPGDEPHLAVTSQPNETDYVREFDNIAEDDDWLIGAYYYPWYAADGRHWNEGVPRVPFLGEYGSADEQVINRHIDWASGHGIDFFAISWWGPRSFEADVLTNQYLSADLARDMNFAIMYESTGRLELHDGQIDIGSQRNRDRLRSDFRLLAESYFRHPNYLHIDGRPVVFVYLTRIMTGDAVTTLDQVRQVVRDTCDEELFLIGDEVYWHEPTAERLGLFDGVTPYNMHTSSPDVADWFLLELPGKYDTWSSACETSGVRFVPSVIPGFDDTAVRPEARHPVIPRSHELFAKQLEMAFDNSDQELRMVMINSWNEWHEDTAIEPAEDFEFQYLTTLRDLLQSP